MRHSAITAMANTEGATEHMVMALSGHKSPQVARRYMRTNKATMDMLRRLKENGRLHQPSKSSVTVDRWLIATLNCLAHCQPDPFNSAVN